MCVRSADFTYCVTDRLLFDTHKYLLLLVSQSVSQKKKKTFKKKPFSNNIKLN